ncbi:MAG: hypothetical protein FD144_277 [Rhodospirillaceae bacterium]|nr:MAG: hypothetical protein FD144_277 [Rhodospirillaceae bacterium]
MIRLFRPFRLFAGIPLFGSLPIHRLTNISHCPAVAQLLAGDLPKVLVLALAERAAANGRSAEAESRLIPEEALSSSRNEFRNRAVRLRPAIAGQIHGESADLIHEDRDSR